MVLSNILALTQFLDLLDIKMLPHSWCFHVEGTHLCNWHPWPLSVPGEVEWLVWLVNLGGITGHAQFSSPFFSKQAAASLQKCIFPHRPPTKAGLAYSWWVTVEFGDSVSRITGLPLALMLSVILLVISNESYILALPSQTSQIYPNSQVGKDTSMNFLTISILFSVIISLSLPSLPY